MTDSSFLFLFFLRQHWNSLSRPLLFAIQLGDLIDGRSRHGKGQHHALERLLGAFSKLKHGIVYHIWGNHDFYNFTREELFLSALNTNPDKVLYAVPSIAT